MTFRIRISCTSPQVGFGADVSNMTDQKSESGHEMNPLYTILEENIDLLTNIDLTN